jgi:hypothetical protein
LTFQRPCRFGRALPLAALTATAFLPAIFPASSMAQPPKHRVKAMTPLTPKVAGKSEPVQILLVHDGLPVMGASNGVRLWVHGDSSHADLRVRVLAPSRMASPASDPLPRDEWISQPVPISFTGWREVVLPQSNFTLRAAPPLSKSLDLALPADAQAVSDMDDPKPDWSEASSLALDVTTARQSTLIVDDAAWVTLDAGGQGTASTPITSDVLSNIGAWQAVGTPDETSAVNYGLATEPGLTHGGRVAFRLTVTPPGLDRDGRLFYAQEAIRAAKKSCLVWTPAALFARVLPSSLPPATGANSDVALSACPEQTQAASFCIYSPAALTDVAVSMPQDMQGIGHVLPKSAVDIHVVKVWTQSGAGPLRDPDTAAMVPELLVKDDRTLLSGPAPEARLIGPAVCDIPADTSKQFWLSVSVPRGTPAGPYTGRVIVSGRGLPGPIAVRVTLTVLPLRLLSPAKQYGIDLRSRLDTPPSVLPSPDGRQLVTDFVTKDVLDSQLADIYAHGFTIATLYDSPDTLWDAITEYKTYGLGTAYNLYKGDGDPQAIEKQRGEHSDPALTYFTPPEPNAAAAARMAPLEKLGIPNVTYIPHQADFTALGADTDIAVYNRDSEYPQQLLRTNGERVSMTRDWWYWPATNDDPQTNRVDAGVLLWKANLYGAFLPDYQTAFGADPYDETSAGACPSQIAYRPLMLTYPVKNGVLDTLQWEACREGVTDVRYLTTMYAALRECKDAHIAKPLATEAETYVKTFLTKPLANLPDTDYDTFRAKVATYAIRLRSAVDTYNKAHGIR